MLSLYNHDNLVCARRTVKITWDRLLKCGPSDLARLGSFCSNKEGCNKSPLGLFKGEPKKIFHFATILLPWNGNFYSSLKLKSDDQTLCLLSKFHSKAVEWRNISLGLSRTKPLVLLFNSLSHMFLTKLSMRINQYNI